jgi:hypothetical protein
VYTTQMSNKFNTQAARYMLIPGTTTYTTIWGDSTGGVYNMNGGNTTGASGDANTYPILLYRKSIHIEPRMIKPWPWTTENMTGRVVYRRLTQTSMTLQIDWDEEYSSSVNALTLKGATSSDTSNFFGGSGYFGGSVYFGGGSAAIGRKSSMNVEPGGKGPGFYISLFASPTGAMEVTNIVID